MSQNKTGKYLKYALGEILLVMIGILLALQVNNWNENRKSRIQEFIYLNNLKSDLINQIQYLELYMDFEDIIIDQTNAIIKHYELNDGFYNMDSIFPKINDIMARWTFSNTNTTLMQMLNSDQINIIQNKQLKEELIKYNQEMSEFMDNTNHNNTNVIDNFLLRSFLDYGSYGYSGLTDVMLEQMNKFYPFEGKRVNDNELIQLSLQIINEPKIKLQLINKIVFRNTLANLQKSGNQGLKERSVQILGILKAEIKQRRQNKKFLPMD